MPKFSKDDSQYKIVSTLYPNILRNVIRKVGDNEQAKRVAQFIMQQVIQESGYTFKKDNNYGGYLKNGKRMSFASADDFFKTHIDNLYSKWKDAFNATSIKQYYDTLNPDMTLEEHQKTGRYNYSPRWVDKKYYEGLVGNRNRVGAYIDLYNGGDGTKYYAMDETIPVLKDNVNNITFTGFNPDLASNEQQNQPNPFTGGTPINDVGADMAINITNDYAQSPVGKHDINLYFGVPNYRAKIDDESYSSIPREFASAMFDRLNDNNVEYKPVGLTSAGQFNVLKNGGRRKCANGFSADWGGRIKPIGNGLNIAKGLTHDQGGIGLNANGNHDLEVENNEIVYKDGGQIKVISDYLGFAPLVALNPNKQFANKVFNAQEQFKRNNGIMKCGGRVKALSGKGLNVNAIKNSKLSRNVNSNTRTDRNFKDVFDLVSSIGTFGLTDLYGYKLGDGKSDVGRILYGRQNPNIQTGVAPAAGRKGGGAKGGAKPKTTPRTKASSTTFFTESEMSGKGTSPQQVAARTRARTKKVTVENNQGAGQQANAPKNEQVKVFKNDEARARALEAQRRANAGGNNPYNVVHQYRRRIVEPETGNIYTGKKGSAENLNYRKEHSKRTLFDRKYKDRREFYDIWDQTIWNNGRIIDTGNDLTRHGYRPINHSARAVNGKRNVKLFNRKKNNVNPNTNPDVNPNPNPNPQPKPSSKGIKNKWGKFTVGTVGTGVGLTLPALYIGSALENNRNYVPVNYNGRLKYDTQTGPADTATYTKSQINSGYSDAVINDMMKADSLQAILDSINAANLKVDTTKVDTSKVKQRFGGRNKLDCGGRIKARTGYPENKFNLYTMPDIVLDNSNEFANDKQNGYFVEDPNNYKIPTYTTYERIRPVKYNLDDSNRNIASAMITNGNISTSTPTIKTNIAPIPLDTQTLNKQVSTMINAPLPNYKNPSFISKLGLNGSDLISAGINGVGSLASYFINKSALNKQIEPSRPIPYMFVPDKIRENINARLAENMNAYRSAIDTLKQNTSSSGSFRNASTQARFNLASLNNRLWEGKENIETGRINTNRRNFQTIANQNIEAFNNYIDKRREFRNNLANLKSENAVSLVNNLNSSLQNVLTNAEKRKKDIRNIYAMLLGYPHTTQIAQDYLTKHGII